MSLISDSDLNFQMVDFRKREEEGRGGKRREEEVGGGRRREEDIN